jgi:hypothetical protein
MKQLDPHSEAIYKATLASGFLVELLPKTDITLELQHILKMQFHIIDNVLKNKHFGSDNLSEFIDHCSTIIKSTSDMLNKE